VAGLLHEHEAGRLDPGQVVVCTVTGHGLKDPQWALQGADGVAVQPIRVPVDAMTVAGALGLD
jgi:threonine synthase